MANARASTRGRTELTHGVSMGALSAALLLLASPAAAQTADQAGATGNPNPAQAAATGTPGDAQAEPDRTPEEVVVTGFSAALRSATAKKKNAETVVESVSAEDLGKLPDN